MFHRIVAIQCQQLLHIPWGQVQESLQCLRLPLADVLGDRPAVLPLQRRQQSPKVLLGVSSGLRPIKQWRDPAEQTIQIGFPLIHVVECHRAIIHNHHGIR